MIPENPGKLQNSQVASQVAGKVHFISLGCPKNLVDSEIMAGTLMKDGYQGGRRKRSGHGNLPRIPAAS